jgi:hypothetical protein
MEKELRMTLKEADRLTVMKRLEGKELTLKRASNELRLSTKQTHRLRERYLKEGPQGLISKRRGKPSNNRLSEEVIKKTITLIKEKYSDYGPTLTKEKLEEKHDLKLAKETLRKLMIAEGIWVARRAKDRKVYPRRTRRSRIGELEQIDGSYEYWFEGRGEKCCLLVCVDDATSSIMHLMFCQTETTQDYLKFLKGYIEKHGIPLTFYSDKHSVFRVNNKHKQEGVFSTKFQRVLNSLDIELICAHSPQAKGRVERMNGVLQDRLIKELREKGISTVEKANKYLEDFRLEYNKKFAVNPANPSNAHRALLPHQKLEKLCMIEEERVLSKNLSFQYKTELYQIDSPYRYRLWGKKVKILEDDGEVKMVMHDGKELKYKKWKEKVYEPAKILDVKDLEVFWLKTTRKPKKNHPWR